MWYRDHTGDKDTLVLRPMNLSGILDFLPPLLTKSMAAQLQFTPVPGALQYILHTKVTYPHNLYHVRVSLCLIPKSY